MIAPAIQTVGRDACYAEGVALRPALSLVLHTLLQKTGARGVVDLDDIACALGTLAANADEVEDLLAALEAEGRTIGDGPSGPSPKETLGQVLASARRLSRDSGKTPTIAALAKDTGLGEGAVRLALRFAAVMGR